jgi:hypothetical protein
LDWTVTTLTALALLIVWVGIIEVGRNANTTAKAMPKQRDLHDAVEPGSEEREG